MSYFDDKQEILKLELTTYGRYLLSKGKLKPAYYAFFDDDILYDGEYGQISESQNSVQIRILDETIFLKPQTTFTGVENNVSRNKNLTIDELQELKQEELQISSDKNYALSLPLGNSSHASEYAPSWKLNLIDGTIDSVQQYIDNSTGDSGSLQPYLKIPQIFLNDIISDVKIKKNDNKIDDNYIFLSSKTIGSDIYYASYKENSCTLDVLELNTYDEKLNFDVEIFIEEKNNMNEINWKQLKFNSSIKQIENNFLLDEPVVPQTIDNTNFSEYYFDSTIDSEIEVVKIQNIGTATYLSSVKPEDGPFGVDC